MLPRPATLRVCIFIAAGISTGIGRVPGASADELPTVEQIVDLLRRQIPRFKNHHSVVLYENRVQGESTEWWRASLYADEFGRVLNLDEVGWRDADGTLHVRKKHSRVNNGDTYMMIDFTYDRRLGPFVGAGELVHASFLIPPLGDGGTLDHLSSRSAFGPGFPWGLVFLSGPHMNIGMDSNWYSTLECAVRESMAWDGENPPGYQVQ